MALSRGLGIGFYPQITEQSRHKSPNKIATNHRKFLGDARLSFLAVVIGVGSYAYRKVGVHILPIWRLKD